MRIRRALTLGALAAALAAAPVPGFANVGKMNPQEMQQHIDTLRQAADALRATRPELADKLQQMADKKQQMMSEKQSST